MKPLPLLCATSFLLLTLASYSHGRSYPDYYPISSGFTLDSLDVCDTQVVENLEVLCRVWGYAKYHHPVFADSTVNVDYELFNLLPQVAKADKRTRNRILCGWVEGLGRFSSDRAVYDMMLRPFAFRQTCDLAWIRDTVRLGGDLSLLLQRLRYAGRGTELSGKNRYIRPTSFGRIAMAEDTGGTVTDCGWRLLSLFRFWNVVEYFFPSRNLTDRDWGTVLAGHIPAFATARPANYFLAFNRELCDSHASSYFGSLVGARRLPVDVNYADDRIFVTRALPGCGLLPRDEILQVDWHNWQKVYDMLFRLSPASNKEKRNYSTALGVCFSHKDTVQVTFVRDGKRRSERLATMPYDVYYNKLDSEDCAESRIRLIADSVGYLPVLSYTEERGRRIMEKFCGTKAIIVDMRGYPNEPLIGSFVARYFLPRWTHHVTWLNSVPVLPGIFCEQPDSLFDWYHPEVRENADYYKGRVIVLVSPATQSQAEYTTMAFQATPRCTVVGTQSAGADGDVMQIVLPGGRHRTAFSGLGVLYPDGTNTQRTGVRRDVPIHATVEGLQAGRDEILEKALEIIHAGTYDSAAVKR